MKEDRNTILIVEDQKINRTILRYMIQNAYDVLEAENGAEAWSILEEKNEEIIAILLDIVMPVMDGYQVLNTIRNMEKQRGIEGDDRVKIIMMTALNEQKNVRKAFEMGCTVYCAKPVDLDKLKNVLKKLKLI